MKKYTPEQILEILKSISKINLDGNGILEVQYTDTGDEVFTISEYVKGSFTRELLELIDRYIEEE